MALCESVRFKSNSTLVINADALKQWLWMSVRPHLRDKQAQDSQTQSMQCSCFFTVGSRNGPKTHSNLAASMALWSTREGTKRKASWPLRLSREPPSAWSVLVLIPNVWNTFSLLHIEDSVTRSVLPVADRRSTDDANASSLQAIQFLEPHPLQSHSSRLFLFPQNHPNARVVSRDVFSCQNCS